MDLRQQAVITKCRVLSMRSQAVPLLKIKPGISVPKRKSVIIKIFLDIKKSVEIFENLWTKKVRGNEICDNPTLFFHLWKSVDKGMLNNYNYGGQILLDS